MGKDSVVITFNNASQVFYPGQIVDGNVQLTVVESLKTKEIRLTFIGDAHVRWVESRSTNHGTVTVAYTGHEDYFNITVPLLQKQANQSGDIILPKGVYNYPFNFQLPLNIPSSYEAVIGRVRYAVVVTVVKPWAFNLVTMGPFTVVSLLDLNKLPNVANGGTAEDEKTLCCLCCKSGPISAKVTTDRLGYVPGEAIKFSAEISNLSNRQMECSKAQLVMKVQYHARGKSRTVMNVLAEYTRPPISAGDTDVWDGYKLHVPPVPPSFLTGCTIIEIQYYVMIIVDPSGPSFDLEVPLEVTIGSIPLVTVAQMYGIPSKENVYGVVGHGMLPPSEQFPDNVPKPVMAESVMGGVNVNAEDPNAESSHNFAPVYTYYNWEKPDPNVTFHIVKEEA
ncbi:hypothetical protein ACJMK2_043719 [Sinanodonta woodiana]|uniref:Arrestin C-terminal-like domain-containing protein n=1 Tax=Sinanodonta woodiana TaxID=1069815 RepID=A0ABD3VZJ3_SINWO